MIEYSKTIESDHRGYLSDVYVSDHFAEEFVEGNERHNRSLNSNRKTHREIFAKKC